ncbi:hypothetical protein [Georgenia faecalis]|nr:hypothetical protein [Georgenia faecalis]
MGDDLLSVREREREAAQPREVGVVVVEHQLVRHGSRPSPQ